MTFNQKWAFLIIPVLTIAVGIASYFKTHFGNNNTWNTVTYLLEKYKKAIFENRAEIKTDPEHYHRITLYKFVGWRWAFCLYPWTGWMVPVARTGHTTHSLKIPCFRVSKSDPDNAEGVAGQTFAQRKIVPVDNLPELKEGCAENDIEDYAERGFVTRGWITKRKTCVIRSLIGIPIEVKNKPWGALVIDSRSPMAITSQDVLTTSQFTTLAEVLGKLLEN
ncbi:MAG TPA: GAF domain-containing protein [Pyrinomonadaceae bacterium]